MDTRKADLSQARSLTSAVFAKLRADILACRLRPNEKLHIGNLARTYDVGLAAVREALSRLVADGLVVAEDQRGFRVGPATIEDLDALTETRIEVECLALRRAILRGGADWQEEIEAAVEALAQASPGSERWAQLHDRFHAALVSACGLGWLLRFRAVLFEQSERYRALARGPQYVPRQSEHLDLMQATLARDVATATALLEQHFRRTKALALQNYPEPARPPRRDAAPNRTGDLIKRMAKKMVTRRSRDDNP